MNSKLSKISLLTIVLYTLSTGAFRVHATEVDESSAAHTSSAELYEKIRQAAISGSAISQYQLGEMFEYGRHITQSDLLAVYWYRKSSAQGHTQAQYRLAVLYDNGWGNAVDKELAYTLYKSAAHGGHVLAQHDLAIMYFHGTGTVRNPVQAYKWLTIASLSGSPLMQKHMDMVGQTMSAREIEVAVTLATQWIDLPGI